MMGKIINTFKYGSAEVKRVLVCAIFSGAFAVGLFATAIIFTNTFLFFGGVVCAFITIALAQTMGIKESETGSGKPIETQTIDAKAEEKGEKKVKDNKKTKIKNEKIKEHKKEKKKPKEEEIKLKAEDTKLKTEETLYNEINEEEKEHEAISVDEAVKYSKKKIKKVFRLYKVKRDHRLVIVDHCDKLRIKEAPAYIWVDKNSFMLLLIEKEPRLISFPIYSISQIEYIKKYPAKEELDYSLFRNGKGLLVDLFKPYLPDYIHSTVVGDTTVYKNLYSIGPGICFTNRSAAGLFDLLAAEFVVKDKVTTSNKVNIYFKEAYKANIKLRDNVIDANGYADSISITLENMAKSTLSYNEFKDTLNLMVRNKLITDEFAMYYMDMRNRQSN